MRLHPGSPDNQGRAVVSPIEDDRSFEFLTAPEGVVAALHAAAHSSRPVEDRPTFLRCSNTPDGLKVLDVGLGKHEEDADAPQRWQAVTAWWEEAQRAPEPPAQAQRPGRSSRRKSVEPDLFAGH